jgi:hypothetical protein
VTPCRLVETYRHFGENFLINIQGRGSNESWSNIIHKPSYWVKYV